MTWFDLAVFAVIALSVVFAVIRGALREAGTLIALCAAGLLAWLLTAPLQGLLGASGSFMATAAITGILAIAGFAGSYFALHIVLERVDLSARAARADRLAGGVFGFVRGFILVGLGFVAYSYYLGEEKRPPAVTKAMTLPAVEAVAGIFERLAPASTRLAPDEEKTPAPGDNAAALGYDRGERAALSEMVVTMTTSDHEAPPAPLAAAAPDGAGKKAAKTDSDPIADILKESDPQ
ncbi:MAG TPA: CvpA family protein [Parvularculaceae bacterium]|nr:CvpA family protein [Parvularculaceae bacterium]